MPHFLRFATLQANKGGAESKLNLKGQAIEDWKAEGSVVSFNGGIYHSVAMNEMDASESDA